MQLTACVLGESLDDEADRGYQNSDEHEDGPDLGKDGRLGNIEKEMNWAADPFPKGRGRRTDIREQSAGLRYFMDPASAEREAFPA